MFDQLHSFYESRKKYRDLYNLCLLTGDVPTALDAAISHNLGNISSKDIEHLLNYVVAESIFTRREVVTTQSERCTILLKRARTLPILGKTADHWQEAFSVFASVDDADAFINFSHLQHGLAKSFCCTFTIAFEQKILVRSSVTLLPIDLFWWVTKLLQDLTPENRHSWLYPLCGLFDVAGQKTIILPWSPLRQEISADAENLSPEKIFQLARRWILDKFSARLSEFDNAAYYLLVQEYHQRCTHFLVRGEQPWPGKALRY